MRYEIMFETGGYMFLLCLTRGLGVTTGVVEVMGGIRGTLGDTLWVKRLRTNWTVWGLKPSSWGLEIGALQESGNQGIEPSITGSGTQCANETAKRAQQKKWSDIYETAVAMRAAGSHN